MSLQSNPVSPVSECYWKTFGATRRINDRPAIRHLDMNTENTRTCNCDSNPWCQYVVSRRQCTSRRSLCMVVNLNCFNSSVYMTCGMQCETLLLHCFWTRNCWFLSWRVCWILSCPCLLYFVLAAVHWLSMEANIASLNSLCYVTDN